MKQILIFVFSTLLLGACSVFETPELVSFGGYNLTEMNGNTIKVNLDGVIDNPNWYAIKVKNATVDLIVEDKKIGEININEKIKMKRKKESNIVVPLTIELAQGAMFNLVGWAIRDSINLQFKGSVKAGTFFFYKKFPVDLKKNISPKNFTKNLFTSP